MSIVLVVVLCASALAFFGCFLLGICRDRPHTRENDALEVIRHSEEKVNFKIGDRKSA